MIALRRIIVEDLETGERTGCDLAEGQHFLYWLPPLGVRAYKAFPDGTVQITLRPVLVEDLVREAVEQVLAEPNVEDLVDEVVGEGLAELVPDATDHH